MTRGPRASVRRALRARRPRRARRGAAYVLVLMVAMAVTLIGLSALAVERVNLRAATRERDWTAAQLLATSALEHALHVISDASASNSGWRQSLNDSGQTQSGIIPVGAGTIEWRLRGRNDSGFSTDPAKPVWVFGTGTLGSATHTMRAVVRPAGPAFSALASGVHARVEIDLASGSFVECDAIVGCNANVSATGSSVLAEVHAAGQIQGGTYYGITVPSDAARGMPGSDLFDYYLAAGTLIHADDLPVTDVDEVSIHDVVLGPNHNPYGSQTTNAEGIYVIDCAGNDLVITNTRVSATLLVRGLGDAHRVTVEGSVNLAPAIRNFPVLLVDGDLDLAASDAALDETARGVNFNPTGSPYQGEEDELTDDTYASLITGIVYTRDDLRLLPVRTNVWGIVIAHGRILGDPSCRLDVKYATDFAENPPPGFFVSDGSVRLAAFSWVQEPQ